MIFTERAISCYTTLAGATIQVILARPDDTSSFVRASELPVCDNAIIVCACAILKDRPVCYGTSRLKNRVCAVTRCSLLKTPTLKSNKR